MTASTLVLCAGIPRSGSTWLYNAARLLLMRAPRQANDVYGAWIDQYDAGNPAPWHVVKVHQPNEALLWRAKAALTSRRDLRDIAASAWKRRWITDESSTLAFLDNVIKQHEFWRERCACEMVYEEMRAEPRAPVRRIATVLDVNIDDVGLTEVLREIEALGHDESSESEFDAANLMHKQHIMDGRVGYHAQTLPAEVLRQVAERYAGWLAKHGYAA